MKHEQIFNSDFLNKRYAKLNEREKLVIKCVYVLGYSETAIAENNTTLFTNAAAVKAVHHSALAKMR